MEAVVAAQKISERKAKAAVKDAQAEKANRTKALRHQKTVLVASGRVYNVAIESTPPERKPFLDADESIINVGAYVYVKPDLSILGPAQYGGRGYVTAVAGYGSTTNVEVHYDKTDAAVRWEEGRFKANNELQSPLLGSFP